jgi:hypothetical protein
MTKEDHRDRHGHKRATAADEPRHDRRRNRYLLTIDPARSGPLYAEAIACTGRSGDHLTNSVLHSNAGGAALEAGDIPAARAHLEAAAQAAQQIGG